MMAASSFQLCHDSINVKFFNTSSTVLYFKNAHYLKAVRGKITIVKSFMSSHTKPPVVEGDSPLIVMASSPPQESTVNHVTS